MAVHNAYHELIAIVAVCTTASKHYSVLQWEFFTHLRVIIFLLYTYCNRLYTCECRVAENSVLALVFGEDSVSKTRPECGKYVHYSHTCKNNPYFHKSPVRLFWPIATIYILREWALFSISAHTLCMALCLSMNTISTTYVRRHLYTCIHTIGLLQLKNANSTFLMTNRCPEWNASTNSPFPPFPKLATSRLIKSRTVLLKAPLVNQDTVCGQSTNGSLII